MDDILEYKDKKCQLESSLLDYLDNENKNDLCQLKDILIEQKIFEDENEFRSFLHLLICLSNKYHRSKNFFKKIDDILLLFKTEFQKYLTNSEIFNILHSNKRILLFLFENKILKFDDYIISNISESEIQYFYAFFNEFEPYLDNDRISEMQTEISEINFEDFKQNQFNGENEKLICYYMRNDMVEDFIRFINQKNIPLDTTIESTIFETNSFLQYKEPTLIEYATFFGSIQIIKYLQLNGIELTSSLWMYAIHGRNGEIIHLLEENHVQPEDMSYKKVLLEAISCHHNELADYIMNNYYGSTDESVVNEALKSYNYSYFPKNVYNQYCFNQLCVYDYFYIVSIMIEKYKFDINFEVQIIYDEMSYILTPLLSAIKYDNTNIAKLLLQCKINDINFKSSKNIFNESYENYGTIYYSICNDNIKILNILLNQNKIDVNIENYLYNFKDDQKTKIQSTPLISAIINERYEMIKLLLSHPKIDCNKRNQKIIGYSVEKYTPLEIALQTGNLHIIELLLSNSNMNINKSLIIKSKGFSFKGTCLCNTIVSKEMDIIKLLFEHPQIDVNELSNITFEDTKYIATPLYLSVLFNNPEMVKMLLNNSKIDVNKESIVKNKEKKTIETPLNLAIKKQNIEMIKLLLNYSKIDVKKVNTTTIKKYLSKTIKKEQIIHTAIKTGNEEIVELVLSQPNIDINSNSISKKILDIYEKNPKIEMESNSALHMAILEKNEDLVSLLISNDNIKINQKGINFYDGNKYKWTSLGLAIYLNQFNICQKLLSHPDIDVNSKLKVIDTCSCAMNKNALCIAIENCYADIVDLLLLHPNIDVNSKEIIKAKDKSKIKETLILHKAFKTENIDIIKSLLDCKNIDLNAKSVKSTIHEKSIEIKYKSTMIYAINYTNAEIVQLLLSKEDLDLNNKSTKFHSADLNYNEELDLIKAALYNKEILEILLDHLFAYNQKILPKDLKTYLSLTNDEGIKEIIFKANKKYEYLNEQ